MKIPTCLASILCALPILAFAWGCATGERFGEGAPGSGGGQECETGLDCYDGDPTTLDVCEDGACRWETIPADTDTGGGQGCEHDGVIGMDGKYEVDVKATTDEVDYAAPLSQGTVVKVSLREIYRVRIVRAEDAGSELLMVLLRDCANASVNRISWGAEIDSPELPEGDYYLALFSSKPVSAVLDVAFLKPAPYGDGADSPESGAGATGIGGGEK